MKALSTIFHSLFHSLSFFLSHTYSHSRSREERVSPISRETTNSPRDNHILARPRPNFDLKFLHGFYPKIYIHIYGRCIRNATFFNATTYIFTNSGHKFHQQTDLLDHHAFLFFFRFFTIEYP